MFCSICGRQTPDTARFCAFCGAVITPPSPLQPVVAPAFDQPAAVPFGGPQFSGPIYAGFWVRFLAALIDGIILQVASVIIVLPIAFVLGIAAATSGNAEAASSLGTGVGVLVSLVVQWIYEAGFLSSAKQATPGKMALNLVVADENGAKISFARASGRHFGKYLSALILLIGYLIQPFTAKRQALHDLLAGTLVVVRRPSQY
jgi:uncharacterized RDD family membrane protein YckC